MSARRAVEPMFELFELDPAEEYRAATPIVPPAPIRPAPDVVSPPPLPPCSRCHRPAAKVSPRGAAYCAHCRQWDPRTKHVPTGDAWSAAGYAVWLLWLEHGPDDDPPPALQ